MIATVAAPARWLSFSWTPERQEFACDGQAFAHVPATNTAPSHDVAHVILAGGGGLPWKPSGPTAAISFAEFNAVFLESLANACFYVAHGIHGVKRRGLLERVQAHTKWFAEVHYAPFPITTDEAFKRFSAGLNVEATLRLAPLYFRTKARELELGDAFMRGCYGHPGFASTIRPELCARSRGPARELERQLVRLTGRAA